MNRIRNAVSFVALALALSAAGVRAQEQTGVVVGRVVSSVGATPLADVFVQIEGARTGAYTDTRGVFRIPAVPAGQRTVVAQRVGLATTKHTVVVAPGKTASVDFSLAEAASLMEPVVVVASREAERNRSSARVDAVNGADVRLARAAHPSMIMNRIAGVHVSELSGEGHSMAIRQPITTKPMYLYLEDGIPTRPTGFFNHNALYEVNLPQSGGIEVLKGPGTALYGSDAIGGVVNVLTRPAPTSPTLESSVEGGRFGYGRLLLSAGNTFGGNGLRVDANLTRSDNWRQDAPFRRYSGTIRHDVFDIGGWQARTVLTGSYINQFDVPAVNRSLFTASPEVNTAPNVAYRRVRALRLSTALEKQHGASLWSFTPFGRYNVMDLLPFWQLTYDPQLWDTRNSSIGLLAKYRRDLGANARVIVGTDIDFSPGSFKANQAVMTRTGPNNSIFSSYSAGELHYDYDVTYHQVSPYVQAEYTPVPKLRLEAGVREDITGYFYRNNLTPLNTGAHRRPASTDVSYTHLSPKAGATLEIARQLTVFASYRNGFRAPSQNQLFQQNSAANTVDLKPVKVDSYEAGIRGQLGQRFVYQVSAYDMTIRDDIITFVTEQNTREATNAGQTRHKGVETSLGVAVTPELRLDASYSRSSQRYVEWIPQAARPGVPEISYNGNLIEQAPRDLASALVTFSPHFLKGGRLAFEWSKTGRYAADPANTFFYEGYHLLNLQGNIFLRPNAEVFFRANNLTNEKYAELVAYDAFQKDQYTPGTPRALYAGIKYTFQK